MKEHFHDMGPLITSVVKVEVQEERFKNLYLFCCFNEFGDMSSFGDMPT